jgi:hypothetical protein
MKLPLSTVAVLIGPVWNSHETGILTNIKQFLHASQASSCPIFAYIHSNQFSLTYGLMQSIDQSYLTQVIDSQWLN